MLKTPLLLLILMISVIPCPAAPVREAPRPVDTEFRDPDEQKPAGQKHAGPAYKRLLLGVHGGFGVTFPVEHAGTETRKPWPITDTPQASTRAGVAAALADLRFGSSTLRGRYRSSDRISTIK